MPERAVVAVLAAILAVVVAAVVVVVVVAAAAAAAVVTPTVATPTVGLGVLVSVSVLLLEGPQSWA